MIDLQRDMDVIIMGIVLVSILCWCIVDEWLERRRNREIWNGEMKLWLRRLEEYENDPERGDFV